MGTDVMAVINDVLGSESKTKALQAEGRYIQEVRGAFGCAHRLAPCKRHALTPPTPPRARPPPIPLLHSLLQLWS